jgi:hypothetical protein
VNSRYQSKQKSARREAEAIFHLLNCPIGFQREHHERIGQGSISRCAVQGFAPLRRRLVE